jgi:Calx-beta domain
MNNSPRLVNSAGRARLLLSVGLSFLCLAGWAETRRPLEASAARQVWAEIDPAASAATAEAQGATDTVVRLPLVANDLVFDPATQLIYASVPSSAGAGGNSITPIDPSQSAAGTPVFVGSEPSRMALSDDGRFIYVGLDGAGAVRRLDVLAQTPDRLFSLGNDSFSGPYRARDIAVMPGSPDTIAVSRQLPGNSPGTAGVVLFDDGVQRPAVSGCDSGFHCAFFIEFASPATLYGSGDGLFRMDVTPSGPVLSRSARLPGGDFHFDGGLLYLPTGQVIDPEAGVRVGTFTPRGALFNNGPVAPDSAANRVYFLTRSTITGMVTLIAYDMQTFLEVGRLDLPGITGSPSSLVRWGANGLAFRTINNQGLGDHVVIIQSPLVAAPTIAPAPAPTPATPTLGLSGTVTEFSTPLAGVTMTLGGTQSATATTDAAGKFSFPGLAPCGDFTVTPSAPLTTFTPASQTFGSLLGFRTADFNALVKRFSLFVSSTTISEGGGEFFITVLRSGDSTGPASLDYATSDGTASERTDYTAAVGTLRFAPGETAKSFPVFVTDDALAEGPETLTLTFSNASGATPPPATSLTLTINDNDTASGPSPVGPASFDAQFYVRQHYRDFLGRDPDAAGLQFWTGQTTGCGNPDPLVCRVNVSAAFFLSIEFQETGFLAYKTYGAAFGTHRVGGTVPLTLREFLADAQEIGAGVVVNQGDWQTQLENNKRAYFADFVSRPSFAAQYPAGLSAAQFIDSLNANTGGALTQAARDSLVGRLDAGQISRAQALREVAENPTFSAQEKNRAFVLMQYFGYLRRNPDDAPDSDFSGYNFWLSKLNQFNGNFDQAEMVKAFISSNEYRQRFGQ